MRTAPTFSSTKSNYYPEDERTDKRTPEFLVPRMEKALRAKTSLTFKIGSVVKKLWLIEVGGFSGNPEIVLQK